VEKATKLLKRQVEKLSSEDFDLEAWKSSAISVLTRIFGEDNSRIEQVEKLKIDYGSWALRDAKASYNPLESCKKVGKEIIESAIDEIEIFDNEGHFIDINQLLESKLKSSDYKAIMEVLNSSENKPDKRKKLIKKLNSLEKQKLVSVLEELLIKY